MTDRSIPSWQKWTAGVLAIILLLWVMLDWHRFTSDFWPLDKSSVGPNLLASLVQWAIILFFAALLWPPTRRSIHRFVESKLRPIHSKLDAHADLQHQHNEWMAKHLAKVVSASGQTVDPHPVYSVGTPVVMTTKNTDGAKKPRGFEVGLMVAPAPGAYAGEDTSLLPQPPKVEATPLGVGSGQQCDGFRNRFAVRCSEFRGLRRYNTAQGVRFYCYRHVDQAGPGAEPMGGTHERT